jgi:hypothetical protein
MPSCRVKHGCTFKDFWQPEFSKMRIAPKFYSKAAKAGGKVSMKFWDYAQAGKNFGQNLWGRGGEGGEADLDAPPSLTPFNSARHCELIFLTPNKKNDEVSSLRHG